jgi:hypothetical protein
MLLKGGAIGRSTNRTHLVPFRFRVGKLTNVQRDTVMAEQVSS